MALRLFVQRCGRQAANTDPYKPTETFLRSCSQSFRTTYAQYLSHLISRRYRRATTEPTALKLLPHLQMPGIWTRTSYTNPWACLLPTRHILKLGATGAHHQFIVDYVQVTCRLWRGTAYSVECDCVQHFIIRPAGTLKVWCCGSLVAAGSIIALSILLASGNDNDQALHVPFLHIICALFDDTCSGPIGPTGLETQTQTLVSLRLLPWAGTTYQTFQLLSSLVRQEMGRRRSCHRRWATFILKIRYETG